MLQCVSMDLKLKLEDIIRSHVVGLKPTPSGWHKANCPMCGHRGHRPDRRERFGLLPQPTGFGMNCFNCGFGARWEQGHDLSRDLREFLRVVGVPGPDIDALVFEAYVNRHNIQGVTPRALVGNPQTFWVSQPLPDNTHSVSHWLSQGCEHPDLISVAEYALSRGVEDLGLVSWSHSDGHFMRKRLLIPFTWRGRTVGFTGRMVGSEANRRNRYYHEIPRHFVYNLDPQASYQRRYTIVTEGVFDALLTDGVSTLGNKVSVEQAHIINTLHTEKVVCPDRDRDGEGLVEAAIEHGWSVSFPPWERGVKDAGDAVMRYGRLFTVYSILNNSVSDPDKIRLWRRMDLEKYGY